MTQHAVEPYGETIEELRHVWIMMAEAFGQPVLMYENIPEPGYDGTYEIRADEAEAEHLANDETDDNGWKSMTSKEHSEYHAEQEDERRQCEQRHGQEFVGRHPLKSLLDAIYEDDMGWCERNREREDNA